jgi:hypothetical protein
MEDKDLVWVPKKLANEINKYKDPFSDEVVKLMEKYIDESKNEWKLSLESLDEDLQMYRGLMVQTKKQFEKVKTEQCEAAYALWEKFDEELPKLKSKADEIVKVLAPVEDKLNNIIDIMLEIDTWGIDKLLDTLSKLNSIMSSKSKTSEIMMFLMKNYEFGKGEK